MYKIFCTIYLSIFGFFTKTDTVLPVFNRIFTEWSCTITDNVVATLFDARACLVYLFCSLMTVQFRQIACLNALSRIKSSARQVVVPSSQYITVFQTAYQANLPILYRQTHAKMALLVASRPPVPHGQITSTIYGHLREGRYDEAIQILEYELQVPVCLGCQIDHRSDHKLSKLVPRPPVNISSVACAELSNKQGSPVPAGFCPLSV